MSAASLIQICSVFIHDAMAYKRQSYSTSVQMSTFLTALKGHIDTDAFINCEIQRFEDSYLADMEKAIACCFLAEGFHFLRHSSLSISIDFPRGRYWANPVCEASAFQLKAPALP